MNPNLDLASPRVQLGALFILCLFSFGIHLSAFEVDLMEARNYVTAREIVADDSWLVPTMNGELRIAKPPLPSWITAALYALEGQRQIEGILRIPAALMAALMVFSVWGLVRCLSRDPLLPLICAAVLATSMILIDMGRRNTWDIYCHSFMAAALWTFASALRSSKPPWRKMLGFGGLLAAAFMSKGPVPFYALLLPFLLAFGVSYGFGGLKQKGVPLAAGLLVFVALSAAWPLYLIKYHPAQVHQVFSHEAGAWGSRHVQPFYFYLHFALYAGVWCFSVLAGLWPRIGKRHIQPLLRYRFILVWLLTTIVLLSVIPEKKERYLLPAAIPMAILSGCLWRSLIAANPLRRWQARFLRAHAAVILLVIVAAVLLLGHSAITSDHPHLAALLVRAGVLLGLLIPGFGLLRQPRASVLFGYTLVLSCVLILILIPQIATSPLYIRNSQYQPLDEARALPALNRFDLYQAGRINLKDVWKVGKPIHAWAGIANRLDGVDLPVVLMSEGSPANLLPKQFSGVIRMQNLGCYHSDYSHADRTKCFSLVTAAAPSSE